MRRTQAGEGEFAERLAAGLEGDLRGLVQNYAARRGALLEEILPEVGLWEYCESSRAKGVAAQRKARCWRSCPS